MSAPSRIVIVGGGQAGSEAATRLRAGGFKGKITLLANEDLAPYQRPPLSKKYLLGELGDHRLLLRTLDAYLDDDIDLRLSTNVVSIDRTRRSVRCADGAEISYDVLILATGARARTLPIEGADLPGVRSLRTADDVQAMRPLFQVGAKLTIIGAGYIGLEVAAVARQRGLEVTVVEAANRLLARVTSPEMAAFFRAEHEARGVRFELGVQAASIRGPHIATSVGVSDGRVIASDLVLIAAGIQPETSLAAAAGLAVSEAAAPSDGIITDARGRTSDPAIYAIGDCACRPLPSQGGALYRLESVHNAVESAKIVAAAILNGPAPALELPWFWSDQYDLKLTIAGLLHGYDAIVARGAPAQRSFSLFYYAGDRLLAVDAINRQADYLGAKLAIQRGQRLTPDDVRNDARPMKDIVAAAPLR